MAVLSSARPESFQASLKLFHTPPPQEAQTSLGGDIREDASTESTKQERMNTLRQRAAQHGQAGLLKTFLSSQPLAYALGQEAGSVESKFSAHCAGLSALSEKLEYFLERHAQRQPPKTDSAKGMMAWCRGMADEHAARTLLVISIQNSPLIQDEAPMQANTPVASRSAVEYSAQQPATFTSGSSGPLSSAQICQNVADAIADMNTNYLEVFQDAVELYASFFSDFSDLMGELYKFISANDDRTVLDVRDFANALDQFLAKYPVNPPNDKTTLFSGTKEECEAWAQQFGLDASKSVKQVNGRYVVVIDTSSVQNIRDSLNNLDNPSQEFNVAQWQAWHANVDMQKESVSNNMQTLTQKYANASSTFDNLVKVLSSTISSLLDTDKSFFNI